MGRYTSIQGFTDLNPNMRSIPYAQAVGKNSAPDSSSTASNSAPIKEDAAGGAKKKDASDSEGSEAFKDLTKSQSVAKPEKVLNPYSSTSGAGSGEFHTYRHSRAREIQRWEGIEEDERVRGEVEEWSKRKAGEEEDARVKTMKRRVKRGNGKRNLGKRRKGFVGDNKGNEEGEDGEEEEVFTYTLEIESEVPHKDGVKGETKLPDDGSFLTRMLLVNNGSI